MKKLIAAVTTGLIAIALVLVGAAAPASAHNATVNGSSVCTTATGAAVVTWSVDNQYSTPLTISATSNASVVPLHTPIAANTTVTFTQDVPAPAAGFNATLTLSFHWSDFDLNNQTGNTKVSNDCVVPVPKDASATIIDTPAACGSAETVAEGTLANAKWTTETGGSPYDYVATADSGHLFGSASPGGHVSSDKTTETFTGTLHSAKNPNDCKTAAAALVFTAETCNAPQTVAKGDLSHASWTTFTTTTTSYSALATADNGFEFSNGHTTLSFSGSLNAQLSGHPCEDYKIVAWHMYGWNGQTSPVFTPPQQYYVSQEENTPDLSALDSYLTETCGVQYQVDIYYNSPETAALIAAGYLWGSSQGGTASVNQHLPEDLISGGWGVAYKLVQGPKCATPTKPGETDTCGNGGTITLTAAEGVTYAVNGTDVVFTNATAVVTVGDGTTTVTATAKDGYLIDGYPNGETWTFGINTHCTVKYDSSGTCTSGDSGSTETVSITFDNPSGSDATFVVTSPDSTVNSPNSYLVLAGTSETEPVGSTGTSGGTFEVSINGGDQIEVDAPSFTGCIPVTPVRPGVNPITVCDVTGGSIDITPLAGVDYWVNGTQVTDGASWEPGGQDLTTGLTGHVKVKATAEPGYVFAQGAWSHWWLWLGEPSTCTATYDSTGVCTSGDSGSSATVSITFDNPSGSNATFVVTSPDSTVITPNSYLVLAGTTETEPVGSTGPSGGTFEVSVNGGPQIEVDAPIFTGCIPVIAGDPSVATATCDAANNTLGDNASLTVDLEAGLSYTITGPAGFTTVTGFTGTGGPTQIPGTPLPAGDYTVKVSATAGYKLNPADMTNWTFDVDGVGSFGLTLDSTFCDFSVSTTPASCTDDPPTNIQAGKFNAATEEFGTITVDLNPNVIYTAVSTPGGVETVLSSTTTTMPDGTYNVKVTLSPAGVTAGYVLDGTVSFGPFDLSTFCPPTGASFNAGATGTDAVCTSDSATDGTITLKHAADQVGDVTYTVTNDDTSAVVYHGTDSATPAADTVIHVGPGHYTVKAVPTNPADGLSPNPANTASDSDNFQTFPITIDVVGTDCDGNLAFTGGTIAWLGFVLAGGMLFLGFALLYMRRRGHRTAE